MGSETRAGGCTPLLCPDSNLASETDRCGGLWALLPTVMEPHHKRRVCSLGGAYGEGETQGLTHVLNKPARSKVSTLAVPALERWYVPPEASTWGV